jgi:hypothetical protein
MLHRYCQNMAKVAVRSALHVLPRRQAEARIEMDHSLPLYEARGGVVHPLHLWLPKQSQWWPFPSSLQPCSRLRRTCRPGAHRICPLPWLRRKRFFRLCSHALRISSLRSFLLNCVVVATIPAHTVETATIRAATGTSPAIRYKRSTAYPTPSPIRRPAKAAIHLADEWKTLYGCPYCSTFTSEHRNVAPLCRSLPTPSGNRGRRFSSRLSSRGTCLSNHQVALKQFRQCGLPISLRGTAR